MPRQGRERAAAVEYNPLQFTARSRFFASLSVDGAATLPPCKRAARSRSRFFVAVTEREQTSSDLSDVSDVSDLSENDAPSPCNVETTPRADAAPACAICLDRISCASLIDSCTHAFCLACITQWSSRAHVCPLCKRAFSTINGAPVQPTAPASDEDDDYTPPGFSADDEDDAYELDGFIVPDDFVEPASPEAAAAEPRRVIHARRRRRLIAAAFETP